MKFFKSNFFLILISIFITLFFLELLLSFNYRKINKTNNLSFSFERFMLFQEGKVFKNVNKIFKFHPEKKILSETFYYLDGYFKKEYSYYINTNNFGLVQNNNIFKEKPSILFLGDSHIEGQGADAWVNYFNGEFKDYQIINGGIFSTGPQQFELLEKHISENFNVKKVVFFYIGDDFRRGIFNMSDKTLDCLKNFKECEGNENYYGFNLSGKDPYKFLEFLRNYRVEYIKKVPKFKKYRRLIKKKISNLYVFKLPINFLKIKFYNSNNEKIKKNFQSVKNLNKKYDKNIIYIQLFSKPEIIEGKSYETIYAEKFIKKISNNHFVCDFDKNLNNFYKIDSHPNNRGYKNLYECVENIMKNNF
tara:strand:+ start:2022 stop:3107 length:1086 start_codon:yes stop_codon:yes gene_type:complete